MSKQNKDSNTGLTANLISKGEKKELTMDEKLASEAFHVPFWRMPSKLLWIEIRDFLSKGLFCALNNSCNVVVILINFIFIGYLEDPLIQASFGLGVSYFMFLYMSLNLAAFEVTGIECGKMFGIKKDLEKNWELGNITDKRSYEINRNET